MGRVPSQGRGSGASGSFFGVKPYTPSSLRVELLCRERNSRNWPHFAHGHELWCWRTRFRLKMAAHRFIREFPLASIVTCSDRRTTSYRWPWCWQASCRLSWNCPGDW
jgi:hypothetical protein